MPTAARAAPTTALGHHAQPGQGRQQAPRAQPPAAVEAAGQRPQRLGPLGGGGPRRRRSGAGGGHHVGQLAGQVGAQRLEGRDAPGQDVADGLAGGRAAHRVAAGEQLVEQHAGRVDVARRAHAPAGGLLGRHVGHGAQHLALGGHRVGVGQAGDAEVHDLHAPRPSIMTFCGLTSRCTMPSAVGVGQRVAELAGGGHRLVVGRARRRARRATRRCTSSQTRKLRRPSEKKSSRATMPGWSRAARGLDLAHHAAGHGGALVDRP